MDWDAARAAVVAAAAKFPVPRQETIVTVGFMSVGIAILLAAILLLWGFRRGAQVREQVIGNRE